MSEILYDFGAGRSDPGTFPTDALKAIVARVIDQEAEALTNDPGNLGHRGMREAMANRKRLLPGVF